MTDWGLIGAVGWLVCAPVSVVFFVMASRLQRQAQAILDEVDGIQADVYARLGYAQSYTAKAKREAKP